MKTLCGRRGPERSWIYGLYTVLPLLFAGLFLVFIPPKTEAEDKQGNIIYFFISGCVSCGRADSIVKRIESRITVDRYNVIDSDAAALFERYCERYGIPENERITPVIFAGPAYFMGIDAIEGGFSQYMQSGSFTTELLSHEENADTARKRFLSLNLPGALLTGILNGLNPCSLSILILLITLLTARELNILRYGLSYCAGKLLAYFGIGTVFFTFFSGLQVEKYLVSYRLIMSFICVFFIVLNAADFLAARREDYGRIRLQLPGKLKGLNFALVKRLAVIQNRAVLLAVCAAAGAVTSAGEFFCTGQIYLAAILSMVHNSPGNRGRALLFLFFYSTGFVLPFIAITLVLHKGAEFFDVADCIRRRLPLIKVLNILLFSALVFFIWVF
jgi:cytochrome c biogenesis protein CcdA